MAQVKMQEILTSNFFGFLATKFRDDDRQDIYDYIDDDHESLSVYAQMCYENLLALDFLDNMTEEHRADVCYVAIRDSFPKIYDALVADYNPLENFFTDREMTDNLDSDSTRTGGYTDTPSGSKERSFTNYGNTGMGTTFESYSDNDFRNISKTKTDGRLKDEFNQYQEQRVYNSMKDEGNADREVEEHKHGNSGIFSKQDLTKREISLRISYLLRPMLVRMIVDVFNKGVWADED